MNSNEIKFTCPNCGSHRLSISLEGSHVIDIEKIKRNEHIEYGTIYSNNNSIDDMDCFQCANCGYVIVDANGEPIHNDDKLVKWMEFQLEPPLP